MDIQDDDILVGLDGCKPCVAVKAKYPNLKYVCIPRTVVKEHDSFELAVKKAIFKLKVTGYPVILDKQLEKIKGYPRP